MKVTLFAWVMVLALGLSACSGRMGKEITQADTTTRAQKTAMGYGFTTDAGLLLNVGMFMDEVGGRLGSPQSVQTSESCAFGGKDRVYYYQGFQVCTNDESGREQIYEITLTDDSCCTQEGIEIGADASRVVEIYGLSHGTGETLLHYPKDGMRLLFVIREGKVSAIRYTAL